MSLEECLPAHLRGPTRTIEDSFALRALRHRRAACHHPGMPELLCPSCDAAMAQAGFTFRCATCEGVWIGEEVLVAKLQERASTLVELSWQPRADDAHRKCAACRQPMQTVNLGTVALDRCPEHGIWFDAHELAGVLSQKDKFKAELDDQPHGPGLLHRLAKLVGA